MPDACHRATVGYLLCIALSLGASAVVAQFMEHVLDWKLIYRTPEELVQLLGQSKFGSAGA